MLESINDDRKQALCKILASNLSTLRAKAGITQNELADRLGFNRQTISAIESKKRDMQWSTFTAIVLYFVANEEIKQIMIAMGIISEDVEKTLNINRTFPTDSTIHLSALHPRYA